MGKSSREAEQDRYAAMLLFQFRVVSKGKSNKRRLCEKRLILISASNARTALRRAKSCGAEAQHHYRNDADESVRFEFIGILDLLRLGSECEANEVWYELHRLNRPQERRRQLLPAESRLSAIALEAESRTKRRRSK